MNTAPPRRYRQLTLIVGALLLVLSAGCTLVSPPRTLAVWVVSGDEDLTTDTPPSPENDLYSAAHNELRLKAALNETLSLQIGLRTTAPPAGPFEIGISDLVSGADTLPARAATSVYRVHYTRVESFRSWYPEHTGKPAVPTLVPDILVPWDTPRGGGPLTLADTRNEIIWIDLHVPATITPGEYNGRLELRRTGDTNPIFTCLIRLQLLPVALPDRRSLPVICRVDPRDLLTAHLRWPRAAAEETRLLPTVPSHLAAVRLVNETMRLFQENRTTPVLWASFPKFRPLGDRAVEVQWKEYDDLVSGWLDGSAFPDHVRLEAWPIPATLDYPSAERNGGLDSPAYARLLAAYLQECRRHFAERGWLDRAVLRPCPPEPQSQPAVDRVRRLTGIVRQSETTLPIVAHLPARSLRGLGQSDAPEVDLPGVGILSPPAMWYEPSAMTREQKLGRKAWFMPDYPPYSGSLAVGAPATDPRILPWQAYRYGAEALWIEHAAEFGPATPAASALEPWGGTGLIYPAEEYGLHDRPLASLRLKRLQRGLQDYELLKLLEDNGKRLLARQLTRQVARWAGTDACIDNLLNCRGSGWPRQASVLRLARTLMLQELAGEFEPDPDARKRQIASLSQWGLMMTQAERVAATISGVRLTTEARSLRAAVLASVLNATNRPFQGTWSLPAPPPDWQQVAPVVTNVEPGTRQPARIDVTVPGLAYNIDGVYPFELAFDTAALGTVRVPARLAVAVCPLLETPPTIDGKLTDWPLASSNAAGDFRLCRTSADSAASHTESPALPTRAFFGMDQERLYVAVRCTLKPGEAPVWQADNTISIDGAIPWGQDVVEILIDPSGVPTGTSRDLYSLQIKPSGLLVARRGCRTEPPMGVSDPWSCGAQVAVSVEQDACIVELSLPLAAFGPEVRRSRVWGFNVTRLDARRGEYSSWSGARGYCYTPESLGNLIMLWP